MTAPQKARLTLIALVLGCWCTPGFGQESEVSVRTDATPIPFERTMDPTLPESARIQAHLGSIEADLRANTPAGLSAAQASERARLIDHLGEYWRAGIFPVNEWIAGFTPVFIDRVGTHCAVGELMRVSGSEDLARDIADCTNFATVRELGARDDVIAWATRSGFTLEECARIQPAYCGGLFPTDAVANVQGTTVDLSWNNPIFFDLVWVYVYDVADQINPVVPILMLDPDATSATVEGLAPGDYVFQVGVDCGFGFPLDFTPLIPFSVELGTFLRGDANQDGAVDVADVVRILGWLFTGEAALGCEDAGDANDDNTVNIADPIYLFEHLFFDGVPLAAPFPECGVGTAPALSCETSAVCP